MHCSKAILGATLLMCNLWIVQVTANVQLVNCTSARTCSECISISHQCKWCAQENVPNGRRCSSHFFQSQCPMQYQINPTNNNIQVIENRPFRDLLDETVQLRPQRIQIDLRVGSIQTVSVNFKQATDYPMDLYYLMDISCTMLKHKESVSRVGRKLANKIQTTTNDFRIGFGSYVDKETIPFMEYYFNNKKTCSKTEMVDTYSFVNHLKLSSDTDEFEQKVNSAKISGNLDSPEGTLDALMQVMVCGEEIGWRKQSDKIVVVATDEQFHFAGDGKIGGVVIPNDGKCHLKEGRYTASTIYDYPSMHHIAEIAQKYKFNLVFTVDNKVDSDYQILSNIIGPNSHVASLKVDDDVIAELIDEVYRNISSHIELSVEYKPDNVDVEIWTNCGAGNSRDGTLLPFTRASICKFTGKIDIPFQIRIRLKYCRSDKDGDSFVQIGLLNKNESVKIDIRQMCQCNCELDGQIDSPKCSKNGTFSCGVCTSCNGIRSGQYCECDPEKKIDTNKPEAHCKNTGDSRSCSGHGHCLCGKCVCESVFEGQFCEQDQSSCYQDGIKCNGKGECINKRCKCHQNYAGNYCQCPLSNSTCICFGRGECRCGRCECRVSTSYGQFCEHCPLCEAPRYCKQIQSCILPFSKKFCQNDKLTPEKENFCKQELCSDKFGFSKWKYEIVQSLSENNTEINWKEDLDDAEQNGDVVDLINTDQLNVFNYQCQQVINGCDVSFLYQLIRKENLISMKLKLNKEIDDDEFYNEAPDEILFFKITNYTELCPQKVNLVVIGSSAFGSVIIFGILTILAWKILTEYFDRKEYEKFMHEVDCANFTQMENPLYKEVTATFRNPVFNLRDRTSKFFFNKK